MREFTDEELELNDIAELDEYEESMRCERSYENDLLLLADRLTMQFFKENNLTRDEQITFLKNQHEEIKLDRKRISDEFEEKFGFRLGRW